MYDAVIIGAGITGCAAARFLSAYKGSFCVMERSEDVCTGTSKANSAIIHAGFDAAHGSLMAKYNILGNNMSDVLKLAAIRSQIETAGTYDDKKKIDFIRVIYTLNELGFFVRQDGKKAKKADVFEAFGKAVDISLDSFSQDWFMQFERPHDISRVVEIFHEMERAMNQIIKKKYAPVKK